MEIFMFKKMLGELKNLRFKNFLCLTVAGIINACGVTLFITPVSLYDSGISGTSILLDNITPEYLTLSIFLILLNIPLFLFGLKKQGAVFTVYAIYSVVIYSVMAFLINDVLPIDVTHGSPLAGNDVLLCAIFGGLLSGIGSGIAIRFGGAMDGVEVMAVIFSKRLGVSVGTFVMVYNIIIYVLAGIIETSWRLPLYSIITYTVGLKAVDFIVEGLDRSKAANIVTSKPDEVCRALSDAFECGVTILPAKGYYSGADTSMVYLVLNRFQIGKMKEVVRRYDSKAYIAISEVADVYSSKP